MPGLNRFKWFLQRFVGMALWAGVMFLPSVRLSAAPVSVSDPRGFALEWAAPPQRIVSLLPSLTESVCALGACDRLVGTDRYSNSPARVLALPKLGGLDDTQVERVVQLRPDVVLAAPSARVVDRLQQLGVKVLVIDSNTHVDVKRGLDTLARMLGTPAEGERVWKQIEHEIDAAAAQVPPVLQGQNVYFEIDGSGYAAGQSSFIGETLAKLGLHNIVGREWGAFPKLNPEFVVKAQPDIVMAAQRNIDSMPKRPGWSELPALRSGRQCGFSNERYELLIRPGPRMGEAAQLLADCLAHLPVADGRSLR